VDAASACRQFGGIARTDQLAAAGVPRRDVSAAVRAGTILRLHRGLYGHPSTDARLLHAAQHGGRLACTDALNWHGLWTLADSHLHVAVAPDGHPTRHGCDTVIIHHWDADEAGDWVVSIPTALQQLSRCGSDEDLLVALESARAGRHPRLSGPGFEALRKGLSPRLEPLLDFAGSSAESGLESLTRWRLHRLGIHCRPQVDLPSIGRVDLVVGDRLILELDGREHHSSEAAFALDRRRDAAAAAQGFLTLRFSYVQVVHEWESVAAAVLAVVEAGLHETSAGRRLRAVRSPGRTSSSARSAELRI
jgi:very-short-patch-repair endonuclease